MRGRPRKCIFNDILQDNHLEGDWNKGQQKSTKVNNTLWMNSKI